MRSCWRACLLGSLLVVLGCSSLTAAKELSLEDVSVSILDADGRQILTNRGTYPSELLKLPQIPAERSIQVTAKVVADGQAFKPQQVFLALKHVGSGVSAYMVGKVKKGNTFEIMATAALIERQIGKLAGVYEAALLVGDPQALDGIAWYLGQAELVLPTSDPAPTVRSAHTQPISNVRPVINHLFRPPEKRPPPAISLFFAGLVLLILVVLIAFLMFGLGVNFNAWPRDGTTALSALAFHGLIAAMLGLYLIFWLRWNLVQTLPVALALGAALVAVGHKALSGLATERLRSKTGKPGQKMD